MEERPRRRKATRVKRPPEKSRRRRPLGLGEMDQKSFPFIAILNGETMIVDRIGERITFTPWI